VRRFFQILLILLLLGVGGTMWYLYRKGFTKPWREWLVDELRSRGIEASFSKLTVEPFRGLIAKDVKIYSNADRKRVLAKVDEIVVEANYAHAARGEPFLDALTLVDASLEIPLDPKQPDGPSVHVEKLNTRLHLPPRQLLVARLDAEVFGVHLNASGQLSNPFQARAPSTGPNEPSPLLLLAKELQQISFEGNSSRLNVRFSGDLSQPESLVIEADLRGEHLRFNNYRLESLAVSGSWQNSSLVIPHFEARDAVGRLQLSASYQEKTGQFEGRLRSGMDLPALLREIHAPNIPDLGEFKFHTVPLLEMSARANLAAGHSVSYQLSGQVKVGPFDYSRTQFDELSGEFSTDGFRWAVRDLHLRHRSGGELSVDAQQDISEAGKGDFRLGLRSTINPEPLLPLLQTTAPLVATFLAKCKFVDAPTITLSARGPTPLDSAASGELTLGRTSYRGVDALSAHANLRYAGRVLHVDNCLVRRTEGIGGGGLAFDLENKLVYIHDARCALHPLELAVWIDPELITDIRPYRMAKKAPTLLINGVVDQRRPGLRTQLDINLNAPVMDYTFCGHDLHFDDVTAKLLFKDGRMQLSNVRAELFGGTVKGEADISLLKAKPGHTAKLDFTNVDFSKLTKLYFDYDESQGKLSGTYDFTGAGDNGRIMRGTGNLAVTQGQVFAIPFLGPFSEILNKIVPGMGYQKAQKATVDFNIADGIIATKNLVIEGKGFSMFGNGRIWFLDDRMDFDMRLNAKGLPGVLLFPVSKLWEYESKSKVSKPNWRLKILPDFKPNAEEPLPPGTAPRPKVIPPQPPTRPR
jgi:hypothetical protein